MKSDKFVSTLLGSLCLCAWGCSKNEPAFDPHRPELLQPVFEKSPEKIPSRSKSFFEAITWARTPGHTLDEANKKFGFKGTLVPNEKKVATMREDSGIKIWPEPQYKWQDPNSMGFCILEFVKNDWINKKEATSHLLAFGMDN